MFRLFYILVMTCAAPFLIACGETGGSNEVQAEVSTSAQPVNEFLADPRWAKQKTGECLMRLEHAAKEKNAEMLKEVSQDEKCRLAGAAHAEHVNSGVIEPVSKEDSDHHHHHH